MIWQLFPWKRSHLGAPWKKEKKRSYPPKNVVEAPVGPS